MHECLEEETGTWILYNGLFACETWDYVCAVDGYTYICSENLCCLHVVEVCDFDFGIFYKLRCKQIPPMTSDVCWLTWRWMILVTITENIPRESKIALQFLLIVHSILAVVKWRQRRRHFTKCHCKFVFVFISSHLCRCRCRCL